MPTLAFIGNLGWTEILVIALLALLLFGGKRLPSLAKDLGQGIREFRKSLFSPEEDTTSENTDKESTDKKRTKKS